MSKSVKINNATYENVPEVVIPLSTGTGTAIFRDTTDATAVAADILTGKTAYGASGSVTGSMANNGAQTEPDANLPTASRLNRVTMTAQAPCPSRQRKRQKSLPPISNPA